MRGRNYKAFFDNKDKEDKPLPTWWYVFGVGLILLGLLILARG